MKNKTNYLNVFKHENDEWFIKNKTNYLNIIKHETHSHGL